VYSGFENRVKMTLEEKISTSPLKDFFGEIVVPTETVVELVQGKKKESSRKFYPGYILINMRLTDATWHLVTSSSKVTGFLGSGNKPVPLLPKEVENILKRMEEGRDKPQPKYSFEAGDEVSVVDGPFTGFNGTVEEINPEKGKIKVLVSIFGRATPVELDFVQVKKI